MARTVFLSDMHLTVRSDRAWPPEACRTRLQLLLEQLCNETGPARNVERVVLLGDIFDTWRCPMDTVPPGYEEILAAHAETIALFRRLSGEKRLTYVVGNHDFDVPLKLIRQTMPGIEIIGPGDRDAFRIANCGLVARHGHQSSVFNRVSAKRELLAGYPIGYYITRLRSSFEDGGGGFSFGQIQQYLYSLRVVSDGRKGVFRTLLDAVTREPKGVRLRDRATVSLDRIRDFAGKLGQKHRTIGAAWAAAGEATLLTAADELCRKEKARFVIYGHTHRALFDPPAAMPLGFGRTYVNTGCWCSDRPYLAVFDSKRLELALHAFPGDGRWLPVQVSAEGPQITDGVATDEHG